MTAAGDGGGGACPDARSTAGLRVLAVEDDALISLMLEDMLDDLGCRVVGPLAHLTKAVDAAKDETFDVALLDVNIGRDAVYPVADVLAERGIPYAFMTGHDSRTLPEPYCRRPGLAKPFSFEELEGVLSTLRSG